MPRYHCPRCGYTYRDIVWQCPICRVKFHYPGKKNPEELKKQEEKPKEIEEKKEEVVENPITDMPAQIYEEEEPSYQIVEEPQEDEKLEEEVECPSELPPENELPVQYAGIDPNAESYFDGHLIQLIGWTLLGALVTIFTLFICYPLAYAWVVKWECKHTVVNGYRQRFDGVAGSLIPRWILWTFLTIITLTIFGWWTPIRLRKWKVERIVLVKDEKR